MILIADCGSTKIDWCVLDAVEVKVQAFTSGINALLRTEDEIAAIIGQELMPVIKDYDIDEVYYYGAGCMFEDICANVSRAILRNIPSAKKIEVNSDLLAAARALCGNEAGIACIMGTGSNSCFYDGEKIVENVSPLGYILGDEGSGANLGKLLVADVLKNQIPRELCDKFLTQYDTDRRKIIEGVYRGETPNKFLASMSPFVCENIEEPSMHRLALNAFKTFFVRNVEQYADYKTLPVNFVGSVAYNYQNVLKEAAKPLDIQIGKIIKSPMQGLIEYHGKN